MYYLSKLCHVCIKCSTSILPNVDIVQFRRQLAFCVPEMNSSNIEFVCETCFEDVQRFFKFKNDLLHNEDTLNKYKVILSAESSSTECINTRAELRVSLVRETHEETKTDRETQDQNSVHGERPESRGSVLGFDDIDINSSGRRAASIQRKMMAVRTGAEGTVKNALNGSKRMYNSSVCLQKIDQLPSTEQHNNHSHPKHLHSCSLCNKMFAHRSALGAHLLTHATRQPVLDEPKIKNLQCPTCNKLFHRNSNLTRHRQTQHTQTQ